MKPDLLRNIDRVIVPFGFSISMQLVLLKTGGRIIYSGPLGKHSSRVIEYFEVSWLPIDISRCIAFLL